MTTLEIYAIKQGYSDAPFWKFVVDLCELLGYDVPWQNDDVWITDGVLADKDDKDIEKPARVIHADTDEDMDEFADVITGLMRKWCIKGAVRSEGEE